MLALGASALLLGITAVVALAAPGSLLFVEVEKDGVAGVDGLNGAAGVASSPDGRHVYVAGEVDDSLSAFSRDPATGALTFIESEKDGVAGVDGLDEVSGSAASPDGKNVYTASVTDDAVATFSRDPATGAVTFVEQDKDGVGGVDGLDVAVGIAASPDGKNVYVAGRADDAIAVFARDPATGALTFVEQEKDGVGGVDGLDLVGAVAVSPDGGNVYAAGTTDDAVASFARDPATGALTFVEQDKDGLAAVDGLDGAEGVAASPDAKHVYVSGGNDDAVATFSRNLATGALTFVEQDKDGVSGVDGLDDARRVAASPDGGNVYVGGQDDDAIATFARDPATGALAQVEQDTDGVAGVDGLDGILGIDPVCDGMHVNTTGFTDDALTVFSREGGQPGTCAPDLELSGKKKKKLAAKVPTTATCINELCEATAKGKLKGAKGKLKKDTEDLDFNDPGKLKLKLKGKARDAAENALDDGKKVKVKVTVEAEDLAGNVATEKRKVKLKG